MHITCFNGNLTAAFILELGDESDVNFTCEADIWAAACPHCHRVRSTPVGSAVYHRADTDMTLITRQRYICLIFFSSLRTLFQLCYRSGKQAGCCHSLYWPEAETQTHVRVLLILVMLYSAFLFLMFCPHSGSCMLPCLSGCASWSASWCCSSCFRAPCFCLQ